MMKEEKENIKTTPQTTDNNSLSVVEARVIKRAEFKSIDERLSEIQELIKYVAFERKYGKRLDENICLKQEIRKIAFKLAKLYKDL